MKWRFENDRFDVVSYDLSILKIETIIAQKT